MYSISVTVVVGFFGDTPLSALKYPSHQLDIEVHMNEMVSVYASQIMEIKTMYMKPGYNIVKLPIPIQFSVCRFFLTPITFASLVSYYAFLYALQYWV